MSPPAEQDRRPGIAAILCVRPCATGREAADAVRDAVGGAVERHRGQSVPVADAGATLGVVRTPFAALACAVDIQRELAARNAAVPDPRRATAAIGIDVGEAEVSDDGVTGWSADIAARLAERAGDEEIWVSQFVHEHVARRTKFGFEEAGSIEVIADAPAVAIHRLLFDARPHAFVPHVAGFRFRRRLWTAVLLALAVAAAYALSFIQEGAGP